MTINWNAAIELTCPHCGHKFKKSLAWIKQNPVFGCPENCGFRFQAEEFCAGIEEAHDKLVSAAAEAFTGAIVDINLKIEP